MREDRTGWIIVWDGTDRGLIGRELLPSRDSNPSPVWSTPSPRKYNKTGKHSKKIELKAQLQGEQNED